MIAMLLVMKGIKNWSERICVYGTKKQHERRLKIQDLKKILIKIYSFSNWSWDQRNSLNEEVIQSKNLKGKFGWPRYMSIGHSV